MNMKQKIVESATRMVTLAVFGMVVVMFLGSSAPNIPEGKLNPSWDGNGRFRILVSVEPADIANRDFDERPARYAVSFEDILAQNGIAGAVDLSSLQVHKFDPVSGESERFKAFETAVSEYDRPCRFDDLETPEDYPSRIGHASSFEDGRPPITITKRKGRLFDREMNNREGYVIWVHTQQRNRPSHYAIYFDVSASEEDLGPSPAPWIGDADVLRRKDNTSIGGKSHFAVAAGDLNGDGLFDLVAGTEKGDLMWFPNRGKLGSPKFLGCKMLFDEEGPIDVGWYSTPFLYDWDADGLLDLFVGTSHNVILWWKNIGTANEFKLRYMGFVQADGKPLAVPESPVPEDTRAIFKRDYYNQPWVGDWDGDGFPDILTGGYTTGLIFHYRCVGRDEKGVPILNYVGPLEADGKAIDATWAAAPTAYDFDSDGKLELLTGSWWWSGISYPRPKGEADFLMYYKNIGAKHSPQLSRRPVPGSPDGPGISRATVIDWNADGLPDLLISAHGSVMLFVNTGTKRKPLWSDRNVQDVEVPWGSINVWGMLNDKARMVVGGKDMEVTLVGDRFIGVKGDVYSPAIEFLANATVDGKPIHHPGPGYGDPYRFTLLCDWDGDGKADLLWGTHQGNIYLHKGTPKAFEFEEGVKLRLVSGEELKVGPPVVDTPQEATDFTILQGSRVVFIARDFDGDGILDLAVSDTYGKVYIFRNTVSGGVSTLADGVNIAKYQGRADEGFNAVDWNGDGKPDILSQGVSTSPGLLIQNNSEPGKLSFSAPFRPKELEDLPYVFWGPSFRGDDWNGDGDMDLLIRSEYYTFWAERSFLESGYSEGLAEGAIQDRDVGR